MVLDMNLDELEKVRYLGIVREAILDGTYYAKRERVLSPRQESYCEVALEYVFDARSHHCYSLFM
jgi:hypothetical protein